VEIHLHRPTASQRRVPSAVTGGNKTEANKTIDKNFRPKNTDEENLDVQTVGIKRKSSRR
jgi:hypothetical protein